MTIYGVTQNFDYVCEYRINKIVMICYINPDAAYLTQAGRCYLQVGNDEIYEQFQSGYSGAVYNENVSDNDSVQLLTLNGKVEMKPVQKKNEKIKRNFTTRGSERLS